MIKELLQFFVVFCILKNVSGFEDEIETFVNFNGKKALQYVGDKFLSFTIDPAVLLAGVSLSDNSLRLAKHLSPAYIRIAGSSTPFVKYFDKDDRLPNYLSEDGNNVVISPSMWFGINEWLKLANLMPVFGLNDADTARGVWNPKATLPLLEISDKLNVSCYWQLGYDSTNKNETRYMQDLNILDYILAAFPERNETWKIVGSDISHIPPEKTGDTLDEVKDIVTAVMWEPAYIEDSTFLKNDEALKLLQQTSKSNVKLWTTAPKSEGPVTFASSLLWAKQLGHAAKLGYDVVFRQPRIHELFSDTPAYWFSVLHKKLMGNNVLDVKTTNNHDGTSVYAHCTRKQNSFVRRGAMTVMIINDNEKQYKIKVKLGTTMPEKSMEVQTYLLTSSGVNSTIVLLNGHPLTQDILRKIIPFDPKIRRTKTTSHILLTVPSHSIGFFVLPGARIPVCIEEEKETEILLEEMEINQNLPLSEEILKLESRSSFGKNSVLEELAQKMRQEMKSDQQYYSTVPLFTRNDNVEKEVVPETGRIDERGRRLFIDRVKLTERQKKHLDFQKKREELKKFLLEKAKISKHEPKIESKSKQIELTSSEVEKILKERAKQRAARRNIVFTDEELDALIQKASRKLHRKKSKRSIQPKQRRHINMQLLERTMHLDPLPETRYFDIETDKTEKNQQTILGRNLKRSASSKSGAHQLKLAERSKFWEEKRHDLLEHTNTLRENVKERIRKLKNNGRSRRSIDLSSKLSEYKMKLAERSKLWDEKKDELLGLTETMRENIKDKLQDLKSRRRFTRGLKTSSKVSQYKMKIAERSRTWDEKKDNLLQHVKAGRENFKEKLNELKNNRRVRRELNMNTRMAQYEKRLAESRKKWEEKRLELRSNTETLRKNMEQKFDGLKHNKRITRDVVMDLAEPIIKNRPRKDINMDLLDTNTNGQKKSEKHKNTKSSINSKKLKDAEATIRQPGQTSSELIEDSLELEKEPEQKPQKQEVYAELADSEDLEEEEDFFHSPPKSKKINLFEKKTKIDPFAIAHPTIDIVEPMFVKPKKNKKKKSKSEDDLQFLTASEEFTDIEDDLPCIHEFFGPDTSTENKKTTRIMQEIGEIFQDEKTKPKKAKNKEMISDEEFRRKKRYINEKNYQKTIGKSVAIDQKPIENSQNIKIDSKNLPNEAKISSVETLYDQSMPDAGTIEADETADDLLNTETEDLTSQKGHLLGKEQAKIENKKPALLNPLDIEENINNYKKEMKKHLKDLKMMLDEDKLKFEEKKQRNKLKLLQLKRNQEMELANRASDKLIEIHNDENQHGDQLLKQLQNLKKDLQLKKDKIDQALRKNLNRDDLVELRKPNWNELRLNSKRNNNDLDKGMKISHTKDASPTFLNLKPTTQMPTMNIDSTKPKVTVEKRSIFDTRKNIFDTYKPMSLDLRMWKPSDVLTLQKDFNPLGINNLSPPNDLHIFQNLLGQSSLLRKRRNVDPDTFINDIDNDINDDIDHTFNEIKKEVDHLPEEIGAVKEEDLRLVLPNKDKFEIIEKNGDTEIKFDHHETLKEKPKTIFDMADNPLFNFLEDDLTSDSETESEGKNDEKSLLKIVDELVLKKNNSTEKSNVETTIQKALRDVSNIQKVANKEQAEIFESFISNFTGFILDTGKHLKKYLKYMTNNN